MKTVTLYRPAVLENALSGFDRYMDSLFRDTFLTPADRIFNHPPAVDVWETEKSYVMEADLPGFDEKSVEIHLDGNTLTLESKKEEEKNEDKNAYMLRERRSASFSRSFTLPENADREAISANFKNGVLSVEIAKLEEARKKVIEISTD